VELADRVRVHAALAEASRLAIVDALALGDRTPRELGRLVGLPTNLLAHHLDVLADAGLIERRASAGDRRRRYVVLRPGRLSGLLPAAAAAPVASIVFVCTGNSARSQFAAALWQRRTGAPADSAGTEPARRVHPGAVRAARSFDVDLSRQTPKGYDRLELVPTLLVSVCDRARESGLPFGCPTLHWSVADPVADGRVAAFAAAFAEISERVDRLAAARSAA
jgi:ArsR family transcriptional regulator, arsenate/arsenite/antimonite-responsive transcriptional repressor / arsenate reductase (thioredoxin)